MMLLLLQCLLRRKPVWMSRKFHGKGQRRDEEDMAGG